jgi:hypothetical protein
MALQVGGVSKIGTIKYGLESRGTALARSSSNSKLQTRPLVREGATNPELSKEKFKEKEKLIVGPRWVPDIKTDWPTGYLTSRRTGRLTVGRNVTLTLTFCS